MEDLTPVVVNVILSFTPIMAVVGILLGKAVLAIRVFL